MPTLFISPEMHHYACTLVVVVVVVVVVVAFLVTLDGKSIGLPIWLKCLYCCLKKIVLVHQTWPWENVCMCTVTSYMQLHSAEILSNSLVL